MGAVNEFLGLSVIFKRVVFFISINLDYYLAKKNLLIALQVGVQQSIGWVHYMFHTPEPQVNKTSTFNMQYALNGLLLKNIISVS